MYAFKENGIWVEYTGQALPISSSSGLYHVPPQWSDADKQAKFGLYVVEEPIVPEDKRVLSYTIEDNDGLPRKSYTLGDLPSPSIEEVNVERDRRIASGFLFQGKMFDFDIERSKPNIAGAGTLAAVALTLGGKQPTDVYWHDGDQPFAWIAADNSLVVMDAETVIAFGKRAAEWETEHIFAARELKSMDPIPPDYTSNLYWPSP